MSECYYVIMHDAHTSQLTMQLTDSYWLNG